MFTEQKIAHFYFYRKLWWLCQFFPSVGFVHDEEVKLYLELNGLVQEGRKWLFQVNFFSFKSAWIFARAFQLSSATLPCIFLVGLHFVSEKIKDKILKGAPTMNTTKQNKSISARKTIQENVSLLNWKAHAKIQALLKEKKNFTWKSHLCPSCTKPFNKKINAYIHTWLNVYLAFIAWPRSLCLITLFSKIVLILSFYWILSIRNK